MRSLAVLACLAFAAPVLACPRGARCAREASPPRAEIAGPKKPARPVTLQFRNAEPPPPWKLDAKRSVAEKPSIWRAVSRSFYERMPGYSDKLVGFSVSPVVVVSRAFETTPTFGIVGSF